MQKKPKVPTIRERREQWLRANHGIVGAIAEKCGVTPSCVSRILLGLRLHIRKRVRLALAEAGAPMEAR